MSQQMLGPEGCLQIFWRPVLSRDGAQRREGLLQLDQADKIRRYVVGKGDAGLLEMPSLKVDL